MHSRYKAQTLTPNPPSLPGTNIHRNPYTRKPHWATSSGRTTKQIQEDCAEKVILSTNRLRGCNFPFRRWYAPGCVDPILLIPVVHNKPGTILVFV
eukprot:757080-Amorphochlora_amoeboformis.AAC.2